MGLHAITANKKFGIYTDEFVIWRKWREGYNLAAKKATVKGVLTFLENARDLENLTVRYWDRTTWELIEVSGRLFRIMAKLDLCFDCTADE